MLIDVNQNLAFSHLLPSEVQITNPYRVTLCWNRFVLIQGDRYRTPT